MMSPAQVQRRLEAIVLAMEPLTREVLLAHRLDNLPYPAIAKRWRISVAEVERRLADAMFTLDTELGDWPDDPAA